PILCDEGFEFGNIHVAFEGMRARGVGGFVNDEVRRIPAARADVGVGGIKVHVAWSVLVWLDQTRGQNIFGGASLMRGDKVLEAENILNRVFEPLIRARPRI